MLYCLSEAYKMGKIIMISKLDPDSLKFSKTLLEENQVFSIILLSDAVFLLNYEQFIDELQSGFPKKMQFYALEEDIEIRNVNHSLVNIIGYDKLIDILMAPNNSIINL